MTEIEHTEYELTNDSYFCVSLQVKQRYINPLVRTSASKEKSSAARLSQVSEKSFKLIEDFKSYKDSLYGCVKLVK